MRFIHCLTPDGRHAGVFLLSSVEYRACQNAAIPMGDRLGAKLLEEIESIKLSSIEAHPTIEFAAVVDDRQQNNLTVPIPEVSFN